MTFTDRLVPVWVWFLYGIGLVQQILGTAALVISLATYATVKGIYVPVWSIPIAIVGLSLGVIVLGKMLVMFDIQNRIQTYINQNANPEIAEMHREIHAIKGILEERK